MIVGLEDLRDIYAKTLTVGDESPTQMRDKLLEVRRDLAVILQDTELRLSKPLEGLDQDDIDILPSIGGIN
jgi:hypothetical protein